MIQNKDYSIKGCDDFELGIKRLSPLNFRLTYDDEKCVKALLCVITGCGEDAQKSYREHLAESIAASLDVAVISVDYFGARNRSWYGAKAVLSDMDKIIFDESCKFLGLGDRFADIRSFDEPFDLMTNDESKWDENLKKISFFINRLKEQDALNPTYHMPLAVTIEPPSHEYQNFGVMAAVDVINAILHAKNNAPFKTSAKYLPCVLVGTSHGGYIANLCAKLAPWLIDAIIDNSSWNITANMIKNKEYHYDAIKTIGFGKEIDFTKYCRFNLPYREFWVCVDDKTFWTSNAKSPNYFSPSRAHIRDANAGLSARSKYKKAHYIGYHSISDHVAPADIKLDFWQNLKANDYKISLNLITDESQIDGKLIKNTKHGMGMSIKTLILKHMSELLKCDFDEYKGIKEISYQTDEWLYNFKEIDDKLIASCQKIQA